MTYNFYLAKRISAKGLRNIWISVSNGRQYRKWVITDLYVNPQHFSTKKTLFRATKSHPAYININQAIKRYRDRCEEAYAIWQSGDYSMNQVVEHIKGNLKSSTIDDFIESYIIPNKRNVTAIDYKQKYNIIKGHMNIKGKMKWKDINRDFYDRLQNKLEKKELSNESIKSYMIALGGILRDAKDRNIISHYTDIPKLLKRGGRRTRILKQNLKTTTSKEFEKHLDTIQNIAQWESFALWLLSFCLRGFYPADIVKMDEAEFDEPTMVKMLKNELYIYHLRSKTEHTKNRHMYVHLDTNITMPLLFTLKRVIAYRWMKKHSKYIASPTDLIKIFDYNPSDDTTWHNNRWALHSRRLRKFGMDMMSARKSFETFAEEIELTDDDTPVEFNEYMRLILLGRSSDPILEKSYSNKHSKRMREAVTEAHKYVLEKFGCKYLVGMLIKKLQGLNVPEWVKKQPMLMTKDICENMVKKGSKLEKSGKILHKGWFIGRNIKGNNFQLESLSKEFIPYWKSHFINPVISKKWKTGGDYKKLAKDLEKETENAVKGKVIKMPSQRRQNQEELYNFNVN